MTVIWRLTSGMRLALVLILAAGFLLGQRPEPVAAHPLGNFTINRLSLLQLDGRGITLRYTVDMAEIPAFKELNQIDANGDGQRDAEEQTAYLEQKAVELAERLILTVEGDALRLTPVELSMRFVPGEVGLDTIWMELVYRAELPEGATDVNLRFEDNNFPGRLGWREIVASAGQGATIIQSDALAESPSNGLLGYPQDALENPLDMRAATLRYSADPSAVPAGALERDTAASAAERVQSRNEGDRSVGHVVDLISSGTFTPGMIVVSLLLAAFWGAAHALTPGHGKAVVAAYLIGTRGTARHAVFLGLTVTLTHTLGVFALGGLTLYLSRYILPETLYPWLNVASGAMVVAIGAMLVYRRLRANSEAYSHYEHPHHHHHHDEAGDHHAHHSHDGHSHSHLPPGADGSRVTPRSLLALGVSGGLVPCPSALVMLLGAISLGRTELGLVLVVAFSLGLATVLTGIGLLCVYARRLFQRLSLEPRVPRLLPVFSALAITLAGLAIVTQALVQAGSL